MLKLKINNVDILPYLIILVVSLSLTFFQLSAGNILKLKYEWELGCIFLGTLTFGVINYYIKKIHSPKDVDLSSLISTEDIRTPSMKYRGFINQGTNISFVKFYFSEKEIYLYYRNFFPIKIYSGPFIIDKKGNVSFSNFIVREFTKTGKTEAKISIASQYDATHYTFYMSDITKKDFELFDEFFTNK